MLGISMSRVQGGRGYSVRYLDKPQPLISLSHFHVSFSYEWWGTIMKLIKPLSLFLGLGETIHP